VDSVYPSIAPSDQLPGLFRIISPPLLSPFSA